MKMAGRIRCRRESSGGQWVQPVWVLGRSRWNRLGRDAGKGELACRAFCGLCVARRAACCWELRPASFAGFPQRWRSVGVSRRETRRAPPTTPPELPSPADSFPLAPMFVLSPTLARQLAPATGLFMSYTVFERGVIPAELAATLAILRYTAQPRHMSSATIAWYFHVFSRAHCACRRPTKKQIAIPLVIGLASHDIAERHSAPS